MFDYLQNDSLEFESNKNKFFIINKTFKSVLHNISTEVPFYTIIYFM